MIVLQDLNLAQMSPEEIGQLLIEAKKAYYTTPSPIMDDPTYDTLEEILRQKAPHHRFFTKIGTPNFDTGFAKKKHIMPMGSQNKVTGYDELVKYFTLNLKRVSSDVSAVTADYVVQPKCDGLSLEIEYQQGRVVDAITRGDGFVGDIITQNVVKMKNFKEKLNEPFTGSIRCEIVVTYDDFEKLNVIASGAKQSEVYSNPRNAASGISQRLDSKFSEFCTLQAVDLTTDQKTFTTEYDQVKYIQKLGIKPVESHLCKSLKEVDEIYQDFFTAKRQNFPFEIDGLVIKINDQKIQLALGSKDNRPKGQVAYKFPSRTDQTRILSVDWQVGPMGAVTPVAKVEPVEISGAVITFASLANYDLVKKMDLNVGDIVEISRRGDVIPHIDKVVTKVTPGHITVPTLCPICNTQLIVESKYLRCPNTIGCSSQFLGSLRLFCATLDILGISDKTIEKLYAAGKIKLPGDFYDLSVSDFVNLDGLGEKSGQNIINQIQAKNSLTLKQVFDAASIPNFSAARIQQLIDVGFDTADKLLNLTIIDLDNIPGFKSFLAAKVVTGIQSKKNVISSILAKVKITTLTQSSKFSGKTFAITGDLSSPRKEIEKLIESAGGKIVSAVSSNTSYLVCNQTDSDSSKYQSAKKLNIPVITENDLYNLIDPK